MAGDWHPIFNNLRDSPRVVRMARDLKCKRALIVGACSIWWAILDDHGSNGLVPSYGLEELDDEVQVKGFGAAMVSVGWIEVVDDGLFAPEWEKHNSHGAKVRLTERAKKRRQRSERLRPGSVPELRDKDGTNSGQNGDTTGTTTTTTTTTTTDKDKTHTPRERAPELENAPGAIPMPGDVPEFKPIADAHPKAAGWRKSVDAMREVWASIYEHHGGSGTETERIKRALAWMLETTRAYAKAVEGQETRFLPACDRFWREGIYETPAAWSNSNGIGLRTNGRRHGGGTDAAERRAAKAAREYPEPDIELPVLSFRGDPGADDPEWPPVPASGGETGRA